MTIDAADTDRRELPGDVEALLRASPVGIIAETMSLTLEVVLSASDADNARTFYPTLGWRLGPDVLGDADLRVVRLTHQGWACG